MLSSWLCSADVVIDALFGTGKIRPLEGIFRQILEAVKGTKERHPDVDIIALDLPSGLNSDSGAVDPACLAADVTITLAYPKRGLFAFPGAGKRGKLVVADIGIPAALADNIPTELITADWARSALPKRPPEANKGTFGRILVAAGSINYIGAAYLACAAASRVGAGLVTLATTRTIQPILAAKLTEVTYVPLTESGPGIVAAEASEIVKQHLPSYNVLLLGCGLGQSPQATEFIKSTLFSSLPDPQPDLVVDADALNTLAKIPQWWQKLNQDAILTPHPGEMSRLTGLSIDEIQSNRLEVAREAATLWHKTVVLKGAYTIVAAPDGRAKINPQANPGLASAGTGDVLAGVISGLLAQGLPSFEAACCGVYLHSEAGERVREKLGDAGMIATDLLPLLPVVIKQLKEGDYAHRV
jgi:NAD(P)H-hydrate epimerase